MKIFLKIKQIGKEIRVIRFVKFSKYRKTLENGMVKQKIKKFRFKKEILRKGKCSIKQ